MDKPIIIHHSDNINIKYIENRVNEKKCVITLQGTDEKAHLIITITFCKDPFWDLTIKSEYRNYDNGYELVSCSFEESSEGNMYFNYLGHTVHFSNDKAPNYLEIYERLRLFSKFHALRNIELQPLIDKAFEISEPKLKEMINEFIEHYYPEEKKNNIARTLKPKK